MDEEKLKEILRKRYSDCDSLGHRAADTNKGICNYCYRNLDNNYGKNFNESVRKLPIGMSVFNMLSYMNSKKEEIEMEILKRIQLLRDELKKSGELEDALAD